MIYLSIGRREMGKTTLATWMALRAPQQLIFDPRGLIRPPGATVVTTGRDLETAVDDLLDNHTNCVVYTPTGKIQTAFDLFAREVKQWVTTNPHRPLAVVVDELGFVN